ncbi:MAG: RNA-binding S4 domain-containing protein [Oscillospiraceae bacterium]|jgi:ribosome-associated protein|nr:RNA-binding S4 domain-containing protein [Oscillospiraceae bacterium]
MQIAVHVKPAAPITITTLSIKLDAFLKLCGAVSTGGQAKMLVLDEQVRVNGAVCIQRGKSLVPGDKVAFGGGHWQVAAQ